MLRLVDVGPLGSEKFRGTAGLGRGPSDSAPVQRIVTRSASPTANFHSSKIFASKALAELAAETRKLSTDSLIISRHTQAMTEITRDELNARLEALESRMDSRVTAIGGKIDAFLAAQAERDKASEYRFGRIESDLSTIKTDLKTTSSDVHDVRRLLARYIGGITVGAAIAGIIIGAAVKHFF